MTINRLMNFHMGRLNASEKKQLLINTLSFELHNTTVYDECGDEYPVNMRFTADRLSNILTMADYDAGEHLSRGISPKR